jgi:hypothetical protein
MTMADGRARAYGGPVSPLADRLHQFRLVHLRPAGDADLLRFLQQIGLGATFQPAAAVVQRAGGLGVGDSRRLPLGGFLPFDAPSRSKSSYNLSSLTVGP